MNHVRVGSDGNSGGLGAIEREAHPLEQGDTGVAVAVGLDEGLSGAFVPGGVKDDFWRKSEVHSSGIGPGLGGDLVPHVGTGIRLGGGAPCGQHSGKMAGFVEKITGIEQTFGVDDEAARFQCDAGQESVGAEG